MDSYNFLTFSIDQEIYCIQNFSETLVFLSTKKQIILYDIFATNIIASCNHQKVEGTNRNQQNQSKNQQSQINNENQLSPLQMHYFLSENKDQNLQISKKQKCKILLGHLMVHYKLSGISVYNIQIKCRKETQQHHTNYDTSKFQISFNNFTAISFGSAFLKFTFDLEAYVKEKSSDQVSIKQILKKSVNNFPNHQQLQKTITEMSNWCDFKLQKRIKPEYFFIFTNDNELYEIKRVKLHEGKLDIFQIYQLDEQSGNFSSCAVTQIKVVTFSLDQQKKKSQTYLILAMEGGNLLVYLLPFINYTRSQKKFQEYYLQPFKNIDLKQKIKARCNDQEVDYSVSSIQLLDQGIALIVVRKCGILLINLINFEIFSQLSIEVSQKIFGTKLNYQNRLQQSQKNPFLFADTKNILKISSDRQITKIPAKDQTNKLQEKVNNQINEQFTLNQMKKICKNIKISNKLVISTLRCLRKMFLQIQIKKQLDLSSTSQLGNILKQQISIKCIRCATIQNLNTKMIEGIKIVKNSYCLDSNSELCRKNELKNSSQNSVEILGHYKEGKIFYFCI